MVTTYNAVSADGFIARTDGSEDFIPDDAWDDFLNLLPSHDAVVMGRKTYETIQAYPGAIVDSFEAIPMKRIVVSRDEDFVPKTGYSTMASLFGIPTVGKDVLLTSGPSLNTAALEAGIIDRAVFNVVPVTIGEGMAVFNIEPRLVLLSTEDRPAGRKLCTYRIRERNASYV